MKISQGIVYSVVGRFENDNDLTVSGCYFGSPARSARNKDTQIFGESVRGVGRSIRTLVAADKRIPPKKECLVESSLSLQITPRMLFTGSLYLPVERTQNMSGEIEK